jgi:ribosomal protein S18 acetylase RimI-like enzyme
MPTLTIPLVIRDLIASDVPGCAWSGGAPHLAAIADAVDRAARGEVSYLAAYGPAGLPLATAGVDFVRRPGAGRLWMLAVHPVVQSCGIGSALISAAERRIVGRGLDRAEISVEDDNSRARALYERIGYLAYGEEDDSWDEERPDGTIRRYHARCITMAKQLAENDWADRSGFL